MLCAISRLSLVPLLALPIAASATEQTSFATPDQAVDEEASPFGPLVAESAAHLNGRKAGDPYRGYHFRILTRQGKSTPGGAYSYLINGRMIAGFAMAAYPAQYGTSGAMTFIVNHNGRIFEKNLGKSSEAIEAKMTTFDPGPGWKEAAQKQWLPRGTSL